MNVVCVRCNTRYEFDDALVSSRGTSVKCTNCGHKFRVHPPGGRASTLPDQWVIRKATGPGGSVRFDTLRELQRALNEGTVTVADEISRDGKAFRPIHAVPELESFFPKRRPEPSAAGTLVGMDKPSPQASVARPATSGGAPAAPDFEAEDDVTAVYSSDQLSNLRPARSATPAGAPRVSPKPAVATPNTTPHGPPFEAKPPPAGPRSVPGGSPRLGAAPPPAPARGAKPSLPSPLARPSASAAPAPKQPSLPVGKISGSPIVSPRPGAALAGTPTIAVTGSKTTDASLDFDTVRPPPADTSTVSSPARAPLPSIPPEDVPTRVGSAEAFGKGTMIGIPAPAVAAVVSPSAAPPSAAPGSARAVTPSPAHAATELAAAASQPVSAAAPGEVAPLPESAVRAPAAPAPALDSPAAPPEPEPGGLRRRGNRRTGDPSPELPSLPAPDRAATASAFDALDQEPSLPPRQRSGLRWVFGLLLVLGIGGLALLFGREHVGSQPEQAGNEAELDALLASGHERYRQGDLEGASSEFAKASALSEGHPRVLAATLLVQVTRCDQSWLARRLWPEGSTEAGNAIAELASCVSQLTPLAERGLTSSDGSPEFRAALLDSFRIRGEIPHARARAGGLSEHTSVPAAAYALAMLDLTDDAPGWPSVLDRLRLASGDEQAPGRAHAALIYALVRSGDLEAARARLEQVESAPKLHPLAPALAAFVKGSPEALPSTPSEPSAPAEPAERKVPSAPGDPPTNDDIDPLEGARQARAKGDFALAERYYQQALQKEPGNVAALTGLGDVARGRGNAPAAISHYQAALRANPQHLPAISGVADVTWANGDRAEAVRYYRRIGPGNVYSIRAQQRIAEFEGQRAAAPAPSDVPEAPDETPPAPPEEETSEPEAPEAPESEPEPVPIPRESPRDDEGSEPRAESPAIPGPAPRDQR